MVWLIVNDGCDPERGWLKAGISHWSHPNLVQNFCGNKSHCLQCVPQQPEPNQALSPYPCTEEARAVHIPLGSIDQRSYHTSIAFNYNSH